MTGAGYLRAWQLVRVTLVHRAAASRLCAAASEWVQACASFDVVDADRRELLTRIAEEQPSLGTVDEVTVEAYGG